MYKYLITGANGFVGKRLCELLETRGESFLAVSRSAPTPGKPYLHQLKGSISSTDWSPYLSKVDAVIHLAARVHVLDETETDPLAAFRATNVSATVNLARQAAEAGVRRFVYVSTVKVNGEATVESAFHETDKPAPEDPYAISKWEAEQALGQLGKETGMEVVVLRPPLVYGPGVKANFHQLIRWIDKGLPFPFGKITNRRSMIFLDNLLDAILTCAQHPAAGGKTFLVCDGEDVSTPDLMRKLAVVLHRPARVFNIPLSWLKTLGVVLGKSSVIDRLTQSLAVDDSRIRRELGWQPPYSLQQGLQITTDWFKTAQQIRSHTP